MTPEQLIAFVAVADEGTFTAAARALHKSQPAVSKLVSNLESELELKLLDRATYRPALTDAGRLFRERAVALLQDFGALESFGRTLAGQPEPIVRITIDAVAPLAPIVEVLAAVQATYPTVRIEVNTQRMSGAIDTLHDARADLAVATPHALDGRVLEGGPFCRVRIIPVARFDHAVARMGSPVPIDVLREHAQVVLRDSTRGELSRTLNVLRGGLQWSVTDVAAKREIIAMGMGWGGLPEHMVAEGLATGELVELDVHEFETDAIDLDVLRRRDRPQGVLATALWRGLLARGAVLAPQGAGSQTQA